MIPYLDAGAEAERYVQEPGSERSAGRSPGRGPTGGGDRRFGPGRAPAGARG
jgi:hypothetical protein